MDDMIFYFKADGDSLTLLDIKNTAYTGNANTYICKFELSKDWERFNVFAVFTFGENAYTVSLSEDNYCIIPYEILQSNGIIYVGLFGTNSSETQFKRISTNCETLIVGAGAYSENTTSPAPPTPDVWEKLINRNIPQIGDSGNWYIWDIEKNEYTDSGVSAKGEQGDKGDKGDPGYTPQKGVDYFTQEDIEGLGLDKKEDKSNKVNSISGNFEDYTQEQYPNVGSVKMAIFENYMELKEKIDTKEDVSNKVTYISDSSTDEQYPSARAVYDQTWYIGELAKGANIAKAFDSYADLITWVDDAPDSEFFQSAVIPNYYMPIGNNIMIKTLDVPDLWVMKYAQSGTPLCEDITADAQTAGMTLDEYILHLLKTQGYFDTKWIRFAQLETQKVDLSEYYTKTGVDSAIQSAILDSWEVSV